MGHNIQRNLLRGELFINVDGKKSNKTAKVAKKDTETKKKHKRLLEKKSRRRKK